ncbi:hypothetical protein [Chlamydiifrater volucris]|uniref:hypothetical protein n=1 Tax=Chlamydiifrater volucris TaxID=2681470 RepID=UPI001BD058DA|nr:hypothetical protein [Chlamydiifrater volucris]
MSSPVSGADGSPSRDSPSSSSREEPRSSSPALPSIDTRITRTFLLLQDLYLVSLREIPLSLQGYNPIVLEQTAEQIRSMMHWERNFLKIARAMVSANITLETKLRDNSSLTNQEISLITNTLQDIAEAGGSGTSTKAQKGTKRPAETEDQEVPKKKSTSVPGTSSEFQEEQSLCSPETISMILDIAYNRLGYRKNDFFCYYFHKELLCQHCQRVQNFLSPQKNKTEIQLRQQLKDLLLLYTNHRKLASCLHRHKQLQEVLLQAQPFTNFQLALIISDCQVLAPTGLPNLPDPMNHLFIYSRLDKLVKEGLNSPLIRAVRQVWSTDRQPSLKADLMVIASDQSGEKIETITTRQLQDKLPDIRHSKLVVRKAYYMKKTMTPLFLETVATIALRTTKSLLKRPEFSFLTVPSPSKRRLPTLDLLLDICALVFGCGGEWMAEPPPSRVSQRISPQERNCLFFASPLRELLHEEILKYIENNNIECNENYLFSRK